MFKDLLMFMCTDSSACRSALPACITSGGQKRESDPLELELQLVMRCHVRARIEPGSSGLLSLLASLTSHNFYVLKIAISNHVLISHFISSLPKSALFMNI